MTVEEARAVRGEDGFDVGAMNSWLAERVDGLAGEPEVRQFPGGASNLTYLLRYPDRDLILRRPPGGTKAKSAHDMRREHRIQSGLKPVFPYVPEMLALCTDESVIGGDFYVMEKLDGIILRRELPSGLTLTPAEARQLCHSVIDRLVELHSIDPDEAGLSDIGKGRGYVRRQVTGWSDRYRRAQTWNVPSYRRVMAWLDANQPDDVRTCVIHNDYRFDNVVLDAGDPQRIIGILDWEMATLGDPLMDLGGGLAYWMQTDDGRLALAHARQPTHLPGMLTRREVVEYYCARTGLPSDNWTFYEVFGLFRLAVIAQQIYYRYYHKQTHNPAFKRMWILVRYLHRRAARLIRAA
ncbi:MAG: phosphotransferase [Micromonosporaceae bacterium]|nr:phosphotransferase [Micromonosporaceae bacterium]